MIIAPHHPARDFGGVTFEGLARFDEAKFEGGASFDGAAFEEVVGF